MKLDDAHFTQIRKTFAVRRLRNTSSLHLVIKLIGVVVFLLASVISSFGGSWVNLEKDSLDRKFAIQFGYQLIQDESFDDSYRNDGSFTRISEGFNSFYGSPTPSLGFVHSERREIKGFQFRWENVIGFQYTNQEYRRSQNFDIVTDGEGRVVSYKSESYVTKVNKYYFFYRTGVKVALWRHFFIGPIVQFDVMTGYKTKDPILALVLMDSYDITTGKLTDQNPVLAKIGGQIGGTIKKRVQVGFNVLYGLNSSITLEPDHKWRNTQGGLFINVKLGS